jgi:hypothetical protein
MSKDQPTDRAYDLRKHTARGETGRAFFRERAPHLNSPIFWLFLPPPQYGIHGCLQYGKRGLFLPLFRKGGEALNDEFPC